MIVGIEPLGPPAFLVGKRRHSILCEQEPVAIRHGRFGDVAPLQPVAHAVGRVSVQHPLLKRCVRLLDPKFGPFSAQYLHHDHHEFRLSELYIATGAPYGN